MEGGATVASTPNSDRGPKPAKDDDEERQQRRTTRPGQRVAAARKVLDNCRTKDTGGRGREELGEENEELQQRHAHTHAQQRRQEPPRLTHARSKQAGEPQRQRRRHKTCSLERTIRHGTEERCGRGASGGMQYAEAPSPQNTHTQETRAHTHGNQHATAHKRVRKK